MTTEDPLDGLMGSEPPPKKGAEKKQHPKAGMPGYDTNGRRIPRGCKGYVRGAATSAEAARRRSLEKAWKDEVGIHPPRLPHLISDDKGVLHPLNAGEQGVIKRLARGESIKDIMKATGSEKKQVEALLRRGEVQEYLKCVLANAGITDEFLAQRLREGLDATVQREFLTKQGDVITGEEKPDLEQRRNYMRDAFQLKGYIGAGAAGKDDDGKGNGGGGTVYNLVQIINEARKERGLPVDGEGEVTDVKVEDAATPPPPAATEGGAKEIDE